MPCSLLSLEGLTALPYRAGQFARGRGTVPQKHGGRGGTARPGPAPRDLPPRTIMAAEVLWEPFPDWTIRRRPAF